MTFRRDGWVHKRKKWCCQTQVHVLNAQCIQTHHNIKDWSREMFIVVLSEETGQLKLNRPKLSDGFGKSFHRPTPMGWVLQVVWCSSDWLVTYWGGFPGICLLAPTSMGSFCLCSAWSLDYKRGQETWITFILQVLAHCIINVWKTLLQFNFCHAVAQYVCFACLSNSIFPFDSNFLFFFSPLLFELYP